MHRDLKRIQRKRSIKVTEVAERISVIMDDIVTQHVDAIVNAANNSLLGGEGVDGAIHRAAGPKLLEECRKLGGCPTGEARITKGYSLPAKWVIHTVGPVWKGGMHGEEKMLYRAYQSSLELAHQYDIGSIAFPGISIGAYGFPVERAAGIAVRSVWDFLTEVKTINEVIMVCYNQTAFEMYSGALHNTANNV
jgi:O-acetyl-ADP-ribose deacetylase (regulator of RNase III)